MVAVSLKKKDEVVDKFRFIRKKDILVKAGKKPASGRPLLVGSRPMSRVGRAIEKGETQGLMKIVVDAQTRHILGAAILGTGGDEAIHGVLDIMNAGATFDRLERAVPIHPTVSELIPTMLSEMKPAN